MIDVTATVVRDGTAKEIPLRDLVPADIIKLAAGNMIPGDVRLLSSKDVFVTKALSLANRCQSRNLTTQKRKGRRPRLNSRTHASWNERREWYGDRGRGRNGGTDLLRKHGPLAHW